MPTPGTPKSIRMQPEPVAPPAGAELALSIELIELETFMVVAMLGSFSLAAKHLHVTQPSVTGRVQRLEASLGAKLLVRTTRKVEVTVDGALLLAETNGALQGLRKVVAGFRERARLARQRVVVAATPMIAALTLPPIIRDYSKRYTDVHVVLRDLRHPEALAAVESGAADFAVLAFEGKDSRFRVQPLTSDDMVLVTPASHPLAGCGRVSLEALAPHPIMVIEQYEPLRTRIADEAKRLGLHQALGSTVGNLNTLLGMLDVGMGATLLPRSMTRRSHEFGHAVVEIDGPSLVRTFAIVRSRKAQLGSAAESLARFVRQAMTGEASLDPT